MGRARTASPPAAAPVTAKADAERAEADAKAKAAAEQAKAGAAAVTTSGGAIEVRASRPAYRRAGFVFGDRDWTRIERGEDLSPARLMALLDDPVLSVRGVGESGEIVPFSASDRAMFAQAIRDAVLAD